MDPKPAWDDAMTLVLRGDLEGGLEHLNRLLEEFPTFGPGYTAHGLVFLLAGDTSQALVDVVEAEKHDRAHGTPEQLQRTLETRTLIYAVRTLFGARNEADRCRQAADDLRKLNRPAESWFLPAACFEHDYREGEAQKWIETLGRYRELRSAASMYFTKRAGLTQLLMAPENPRQMVPVHFARHQRARRAADLAGAKKHLKRMQDLVLGLEPYDIVGRYANNEIIVREG